MVNIMVITMEMMKTRIKKDKKRNIRDEFTYSNRTYTRIWRQSDI